MTKVLKWVKEKWAFILAFAAGVFAVIKLKEEFGDKKEKITELDKRTNDAVKEAEDKEAQKNAEIEKRAKEEQVERDEKIREDSQEKREELKEKIAEEAEEAAQDSEKLAADLASSFGGTYVKSE